jgi:hypothetical protein
MRVVERYQAELVTECVQQNGVLRVQVNYGIDVGPHAICPLMELPLT